MWYKAKQHKEGVLNLNTTILAVNSVTYAVKAKRLLRQIGIYANLIKTDEIRAKNGCQYALEINSDDFLAAVAALRAHSINYTVLNS